MPIVQEIENARAERVAEGVAASVLTEALRRSEGALKWLNARYQDRVNLHGTLPDKTRPEIESRYDLPRMRRSLGGGYSPWPACPTAR